MLNDIARCRPGSESAGVRGQLPSCRGLQGGGQVKTFTIHNDDCLTGMAALAENSIDAIVTDPPYGLSFMGKMWDHGVPGAAFWQEALRVAKPGAHLLAFGGTRTYHRLACAIEDAGWEVRDCIAWVYGSGFPKSLDVSKAIDKAAGAEREVVGMYMGATNIGKTSDGKRGYGCDGESTGGTDRTVFVTAPATDLARQWSGWGTALKPAFEPIIVARKPLIGTVAENVTTHGTGAMNVDGCRVEGVPPSVPQPQFNSPTGRTYGMKTGEGRNGYMSQALGRWPANLIHDGSEEVVGLFPQNAGSAGGQVKHAGKQATTAGKYGTFAGRSAVMHIDSGSAARFFYCAKASKADRDEGLEEVAARKNTHPTVKPNALMRYLCRLITPPNGLILDMFTGSGSTGKAAMLEGFRFIGFEKEAEYAEIARARCAAVLSGQPLLQEAV